MQNVFAVAGIALALSLLYVFAARIRARNAAAAPADAASEEATIGEELVAVIAAAIAAARGDAEPGSFRITGLAPSRYESGAPCFAGRLGKARRPRLNTPAWGHVDRFARGESE